MDKFTLFYSWQSDKPRTKQIIAKKLKSIKTELEQYDICLVLDEDTRNRVGTENIDNAVLSKIDVCDIFLADVSPVTKLSPRKEGGHYKLIPNSNVMYEYGYAKGVRKMDKCILLANLVDGENKEDLPFDINHDTITEFKEESDLNGLKGWILKIIEDVKNETPVVMPVGALVQFDGYRDTATIKPSFEKREYVKPSNKMATVGDAYMKASQTTIGTLSSSTKLLQAAIESVTRPVVQAQIVKPIQKKTFLDRCPISFVISNYLDVPLTNCKVYIQSKQTNVSFYDSDVEEAFFPRIKHMNDILISNDKIFRHWEIINPKENMAMGETFISVPHDVTDVVLEWHISSAQGNAYGELKVISTPSFEYEEIESEKLAGETHIEGKVLTE